jgi:hypothetical protein
MKSLCLTLLLLVSSISFSQKWIDLANVSWRTSPFNSFENGQGFTRHMNMYTANAKLPAVLNDNNVLIFGLEYQHTTISVSEPTPLYKDYSFASSMLQVGWEHKWNPKSKMLFMSLFRFNSDYNDVNLKHHFQIGGLALGTTSRSENFDWKYGLYYNSELFAPMFVPLFGFNWKINEKWRFKMIIPLNLELAYRPKDWFRTGLRFDGVNGSFAYQNTPGLGATNGYIDKADNNVWGFAEFNLGKNVWFHLKAGHSVIRKYRYFQEGDRMNLKLGPVNIGDDRNSDDPKAVTPIIRDGWSFEAKFIYRLPLK